MDDNTTLPAPSPIPGDSPPPAADDTRWRRPTTGRVVAGVAAGIARHVDLPLWVIRSLFVITSLTGGFGIAAYLVGWALMPEDGRDSSLSDDVRERLEGSRTASETLGIVLMGIAGIVLLATTGIVSSPLIFAAVLVVAGIALTRPARD